LYTYQPATDNVFKLEGALAFFASMFVGTFFLFNILRESLFFVMETIQPEFYMKKKNPIERKRDCINIVGNLHHFFVVYCGVYSLLNEAGGPIQMLFSPTKDNLRYLPLNSL
jgi:hypothetical protein